MAHRPHARFRFRRRPDRGFTLLETVITVFLIGVLATIALPAYTKYRDRAKTIKVSADMGALQAQIELFARDQRAYPASLAAAGLGGSVDPWGNPYVYYNVEANGRGHARKDHALNPINTDYDLYSMGPDGVTKPQITHRDSLDDIIRASNGRYLGVASAF